MSSALDAAGVAGGRLPTLAAWGAGVDSTAMIIELVSRGEPPDAVLLAEMPERPETLDFIPIFRRWMNDHGVFNQTVRYTPKRFKHWPPYYDLLENLLTNGTLPSISFNRSSCSLGPAKKVSHLLMVGGDTGQAPR